MTAWLGLGAGVALLQFPEGPLWPCLVLLFVVVTIVTLKASK